MPRGDLGAYNIADLREQAKRRLPRGIFEFIDRGAEDDIAVQNNRAAYDQLKLRNRVLVDVSGRSLETEIFGQRLAMPFAISPTGCAGLAWYDGEVAIARAAARMNVPFTVATNALTSMEDIWKKAGGNLWFQLYIWSDKDLSMRFVERVRSVGFNTMMITVDGPVGPNREYNNKNGFSMPLNYSARFFAHLLARPRWLASVLFRHMLHHGIPKKENYPDELSRKISNSDSNYLHAKSDSQNWDDVKRVRDMWPGHLLIKGLQSHEDAVLAAEAGLDGVVLSNHGGRYVDSAPAPLQVIAETRAAVGNRLKIIVDSGPRRGADIIKALACGADVVMSGRPTLFGAAARGERGAFRALEIFDEELDRLMAQLGLNAVEEIGPQVFWNPPDWVPAQSSSPTRPTLEVVDSDAAVAGT